MESTLKKERTYVGVKETFMYGLGNSGQVFGYNLVAGGYLSFFFVTVFGIPASAVSFMILVLGIWDTINDPLMGSVIDKTRTRYGKLRPYLLVVPIPLSIATIFLFAGPVILQDTKATIIKIVYMYISYILWEFFYTIGDVPFWGMSAAVSPSFSDRTRVITTARFMSSILGGLSSTLLSVLIDLSNNGVISWDLKHVFCFMGILAGTIGMGLFWLTGFFVKERVVQSIEAPKLIDGFKYMFKNKPLMLIVLGNVLGTLGGIAGVFASYYYITVLGYASAGVIVGLSGVCGTLTYAFIGKIKKKFNNRQIVFLNGIIRAVVSAAVFVIGAFDYDNPVLIIPLLFVQNAVFSIFDTINMVIPTEMIGETVDYMEWKSGVRNEGTCFSVLTFVGKLTGSVSMSIGTALLPIIGYVVVNDKVITNVGGVNTNFWLWAFFTIIPNLLRLVSLIPYLFYDLYGKKLETIQSDLQKRREAISKQVSGIQDTQQM